MSKVDYRNKVLPCRIKQRKDGWMDFAYPINPLFLPFKNVSPAFNYLQLYQNDRCWNFEHAHKRRVSHSVTRRRLPSFLPPQFLPWKILVLATNCLRFRTLVNELHMTN